ncbi:hypothetical protein JQ621_02310 [Bradyrhizobium manausense]|uniref:hypothetical protein n=1 Tax=Bradyrhizobium manausense TaxID=989370 RepID=UPI001BA9128B|nr:hypothetical protein [Bradyrhizobium manausense]MBR1086304.1 hypothetical protein [Bradyrhizobium manausense]
MEAVTRAARINGKASRKRNEIEFDLTFLPENLTQQCRSLIESYHEVHGFASLPNMLWQFRMGPLIERHGELRHLLRKASTTRSAKKANEGFVQIATTILSLEILASSFAGWRAIYPEAGETALDILQQSAHGPHMPLMEFYLYPPKQISAAAVAALAVPQSRLADEVGLYRASKPELLGAKRALQYASMLREGHEAVSSGPATPARG